MSRHGPPGEPPGPHPPGGEYGPPSDPWGQGAYPPGRYDRGGPPPGGRDQGGHHPGGYDPGYDRGGYGASGEPYAPGGYDRGDPGPGYGRGGYERGGYDPGGYEPGYGPGAPDPGYGPGYGPGYDPRYGPEPPGGPGGYPPSGPEPYDEASEDEDGPPPPRYDDPPRRPIGLYAVVAALVVFAAVGVGYALFLLTGQDDDPSTGPVAGATGTAAPDAAADPDATFDNIGMNAAMARVDDCLVNDGSAAEPALRIVACDAVEEAGQLFRVLEIVDEPVEGAGEEANEQAQEFCLGTEGYTHHYYEVGETTNFVLCMAEHDPTEAPEDGEEADDDADGGSDDNPGGGDGY